MAEVDVGYGNVFEKTNKAYESGKKVIIHRGGTGSGKTEDIMIFLLFAICMVIPDLVITVVSESRPHLEIGAIRILKKHLIKTGIWSDNNYNGSIGRFTAPNNSIIEFFSADRIGKALGARRDWLYGNEVNSLKEEIWDELARRSKYIVADFNPTSEFWLEEWLPNYLHTIVIRSNYLDNPFLGDNQVLTIEGWKKTNHNKWLVFGQGEYGEVRGAIYTNWEICDVFPKEIEKVWYGLDFGFTNDPTTLIKVGQQNGELFVDELIYETNMTNQDIAQLMRELGLRHVEIICDSAEPKSIEELKREGFRATPAKKGPDSIKNGIDILQRYKINITRTSKNFQDEIINYIWKENRSKGEFLNQPVDDWNHALDALRYVGLNKLKTKTSGSTIVFRSI